LTTGCRNFTKKISFPIPSFRAMALKEGMGKEALTGLTQFKLHSPCFIIISTLNFHLNNHYLSIFTDLLTAFVLTQILFRVYSLGISSLSPIFSSLSRIFSGLSPNFSSPSPNFSGPSLNFSGSSLNFSSPSQNISSPSQNISSPSRNLSSPSQKYSVPHKMMLLHSNYGERLNMP